MTGAEGWIDSHCHLDALESPTQQWVQKAKEAGVARIVTVGTDLETSLRSVELAELFDEVWAVVGIHPHDSPNAKQDALSQIASLAQHPKVVAIGEIGLDYYRDYAPRDAQKAAFAAQLELAAELGKPVVLHIREAFDDTLQILDEAPPQSGVVFHCFSGGLQEAAEASRRGFVSFAGNLTFKNAEVLRAAAKVIPHSRLLIETDSPYLAPVPFRGKANQPALVSITGTALAQLMGADPAAFSAVLAANSRAAFGWEA